jgi:CelD/BcsL family acetyltransferase involved in cellulose biosynthesis
LQGCGLVSWNFHHLLVDQGHFRPYQEETFDSPYLDLSGGYDAYARRRSEAGTRQFRQVEASRRRLECEVGAVRFDARSADHSILAQIMDWKVAKLEPRGFRGFAPWLAALLAALSRTESENFSGMLSALYAGDELIAAHVGMRSRLVWHYWFPAYNARFGRYQPGLILLLEMARHAEVIGLKRIDLGSGDELYKKRLADAFALLAQGRIVVPPA